VLLEQKETQHHYLISLFIYLLDQFGWLAEWNDYTKTPFKILKSFGNSSAEPTNCDVICAGLRARPMKTNRVAAAPLVA